MSDMFGAPIEEVWMPSKSLVKDKKKKRKQSKKEKRKAHSCYPRDPVCDLQAFGYSPKIDSVMNDMTAVDNENMVSPFPSSYAHGSSKCNEVDFYSDWELSADPQAMDNNNMYSYEQQQEEESDIEEEDMDTMGHPSPAPSPPVVHPSVPEPAPITPDTSDEDLILYNLGLYIVSGIFLIIVLEQFVRLGKLF